MAHFVALDEVWAMLDRCLDGHTRKPSLEYWTIKFKGPSDRRLPVGPHGRKSNVRVQSGHVRALVRFSEIQECADGMIDIR